MIRQLTITITLMSVHWTDSFSSGAPQSSCVDMAPRHGFSPQTGDPPMQIVMDRHVVARDSYIRVTIRSRRAFKGFLLFAEAENTKFVGMWTIPYLTDVSHVSESRYLHCGSRVQSAVTQSGQTPDVWVVSFQWSPGDEELPGTWVIFRATIVESYEVFWTDIVSAKVWIVDHEDHSVNEIEKQGAAVSDKRTSYYNYNLYGKKDAIPDDLNADNLTDFVHIFQDYPRLDDSIGDQITEESKSQSLEFNQIADRHATTDTTAADDMTTHAKITNVNHDDIIDDSFEENLMRNAIDDSPYTSSLIRERSQIAVTSLPTILTSNLDQSERSIESPDYGAANLKPGSIANVTINSSSVAGEKFAEEPNNGSEEKFEKLMRPQSETSTNLPEPIFVFTSQQKIIYNTSFHSPTENYSASSAPVPVEDPSDNSKSLSLSRSQYFNVSNSQDEDGLEDEMGNEVFNGTIYPHFYAENATEVILINFSELQRSPRNHGDDPEYEALEGPYQRLQARFGGWNNSGSRLTSCLILLSCSVNIRILLL